MNLYQVMTNHYSQKDSRRGIWAYVVAESSESLYEWLKTKPSFDDEIGTLFVSFDGYEEDCEYFKSQMIESMDEESTDCADYDDLYYGKTFVSWELVKEDVKPDILQKVKDYGIRLLDSRAVQ